MFHESETLSLKWEKTEHFHIARFGERKKRKYLVIPVHQKVVEWVWVSLKINGATYVLSFVFLTIQVRSVSY